MAAAGLSLALGYRTLARGDARHAEFYESGKSINGFLTGYAEALQASHASAASNLWRPFYSNRYRSQSRGNWTLVESKLAANVQISDLTPTGRRDFGLSEIDSEIQDYLAGVQRIDRIEMKIDLIDEVVPRKSASVKVKFVLDGITTSGTSFQDRFLYRWLLSHQSSDTAPEWQIVRDELIEGIRVEQAGSGFTRLDLYSSGIDYHHARDPKLDIQGPDIKFGVMQHGIGGVTSYDYDRDGRPDIFFADGERSRLYRNLLPEEGQRLRFEDVTETSGLDGIDQATSGYFADFDNDGDDDLIVLRYLAPSLFFTNEEGTFSDATVAKGFHLDTSALSATLLDYDLDGFLDIYVGVYGDAFETVPRLPFLARNRQVEPPVSKYRGQALRRCHSREWYRRHRLEHGGSLCRLRP